MAAKRHTSSSASRVTTPGAAHKDDVRKRRQQMRLLVGILGPRLPIPQSALQSVLLMNLHRAAQGRS